MELEVGTKVVTRPDVRMRRFAADFPGWDAPDAKDFLLDTPAGLYGTVTRVIDHGSNPWTRYSIVFEDGTWASDMVWGQDFDVIKM